MFVQCLESFSVMKTTTCPNVQCFLARAHITRARACVCEYKTLDDIGRLDKILFYITKFYQTLDEHWTTLDEI